MANNINLTLEDITTAVASLTTEIGDAATTLRQGMAELSEAMRAFRSCECPMGEVPEPEPTTEGDPPPTGFTEYDGGITDRKCKLSNMVFDDLLSVTNQLKELGIENALALGVGAATSIVSVIIGLLASGPLGWGLAVLGAVIGVVMFFITSSIDLDALIGIMETQQADLVNAIYNAPDNATALADMKAALTAGGANAVHLAYIDALSLLNGLTAVFFLPDGDVGIALNQRLDGYPVTISCTLSQGTIWITNPLTPFNGIQLGAFTDNFPSGWQNQGDAYDDADGWNDDNDSSYPDTYFEIENPAFGHPELANNDPEFDQYWVTVRIDFTGYNGAWRFQLINGFDEQGSTKGPGYSSGYFRSGKDTELVSWESWPAGLIIASEFLRVHVGHGGDTNTTSGKLSIKQMTMRITDDIF